MVMGVSLAAHTVPSGLLELQAAVEPIVSVDVPALIALAIGYALELCVVGADLALHLALEMAWTGFRGLSQWATCYGCG